MQLHEHLEAIATDGSVGCVVLQDAGRSFCAGLALDSIPTGGIPGHVLDRSSS